MHGEREFRLLNHATGPNKTNHLEAGSAHYNTILILGCLTFSLILVLVGVARDVVELGIFVAKVIEIDRSGEGIATKDVVFLAVVRVDAAVGVQEWRRGRSRLVEADTRFCVNPSATRLVSPLSPRSSETV